MEKRVNVAIVGATGIVGESMLDILEERQFPIEKLFLLASEQSEGIGVEFCDELITVQDVKNFNFNQVDIALFSAGMEVSAKYAPIAANAGALVIDNSMQFRYVPEVPLVVPEVNPETIAEFSNSRIIANPNCSTIQMVVALKPIYDAVGISRINVTTYQSVSGAGKAGIEELIEQTSAFLNSQAFSNKTFPTQIAFNVIPQIDQWMNNGYSREEMKMVAETQKILNDHYLAINPTTVRVPVFIGHSMAVNIETKEKISAEQVRKILLEAPGIILMDEGSYPTPAVEGNAQDGVYVGRIREDISHPQAINLWIVADNVRKGAALNAIQIAEIYLKEFFDGSN